MWKFVFLLTPALALAHEYGPDARYTGAPGDNPLACAACHSNSPTGGPINPAGGSVTAVFSSGGTYVPGGPPITISVNVTDPKNTHFGYQMTARLDSDLANGQAGDFTPGANQIVLCNDSSVRLPGKSCPSAAAVEFVEHSFPAGSQVSTTPYTFTWTPPATNVGPVHFYVAGNSVNGDLKADGNDRTYTASYMLTPATSPPPNLTSAGSMAQVASAGGWATTFTIVNNGAASANTQLNFFDDNGNPMALPLTYSGSSTTASTFNQSVPAGGTLVLQSTGPGSAPTSVGSAQLLTDGTVGAFATFALTLGANNVQEAVVPLENRAAGGYVLVFDNTNGAATGVALANNTNQPLNVSVTGRDNLGNQTGQTTLSLAGSGHSSYNLADPNSPFGSFTVGRSGTLEFRSPSSGQIAVLGLYFNSNFAFSTIPAIAK
ncbi:MAG TPA: choice-of-anchor V domain-containing protein [Bryobacteraceae bacterium]|jgi:hypothetical protein